MDETTKTPIVIPTAEPFYFSGNEIGCLLVHGFTASPNEMRPLGEFLNKQGYSVLGIRVTGHATNIENLRRVRWRDLVASVEDGYQLLKSNKKIKKIFIVGLSMGGMLSLFVSSYLNFDGVVSLAAPYQFSKEGFINEYLMAINMSLASLKRKLKSRQLKNSLPGWNWYKPELSRGYIKYNQKPIICGLQMVRLANQLPYAVRKINCPIILIHSHSDSIVNPHNMEIIYASLASKNKEMIWLEKSNHVLPIDGERDKVFEHINAFIKKTLKNK